MASSDEEQNMAGSNLPSMPINRTIDLPTRRAVTEPVPVAAKWSLVEMFKDPDDPQGAPVSSSPMKSSSPTDAAQERKIRQQRNRKSRKTRIKQTMALHAGASGKFTPSPMRENPYHFLTPEHPETQKLNSEMSGVKRKLESLSESEVTPENLSKYRRYNVEYKKLHQKGLREVKAKLHALHMQSELSDATFDKIGYILDQEILDLDQEVLQAIAEVRRHSRMNALPEGTTVVNAFLESTRHSFQEAEGGVKDYKPPSGRPKDVQDDFKHRLIRYYDARHPEDRNYLWDPLLSRWVWHEDVVAAHIVPHAYGASQAAHVLGIEKEDGSYTIWNTRNGLLLSSQAEKALDYHRIAIVPKSNGIDFKVICLDQSLVKMNRTLNYFDRSRDDTQQLPSKPWRQIDQTTLQFRPQIDGKPVDVSDDGPLRRPGKRFLLLKNLMAMFIRHRQRAPGWENDRALLRECMWATPEKYLQKGILPILAKHVGEYTEAEMSDLGYSSSDSAMDAESDRDVHAVLGVKLMFDAAMSHEFDEHAMSDNDGEESEGEEDDGEEDESDEGTEDEVSPDLE